MIAVFSEDDTLSIQAGRWGAYIKHGKLNYKLPKEYKDKEKAALLTYNKVVEIMENQPTPKGAKTTKKTEAKKTTKKSTTKKASKTTKKKK